MHGPSDRIGRSIPQKGRRGARHLSPDDSRGEMTLWKYAGEHDAPCRKIRVGCLDGIVEGDTAPGSRVGYQGSNGGRQNAQEDGSSPDHGRI
jgi:hypothetical protein